MIVLSLAGAVLAGFNAGRRPRRSLAHMVVFAAVIAMLLYLTVDLTLPRSGLIRADAADTYDRGVSRGGTMRQMMAILNQPNRAPRLRALTMPALVVHGLAGHPNAGSHDPEIRSQRSSNHLNLSRRLLELGSA